MRMDTKEYELPVMMTATAVYDWLQVLITATRGYTTNKQTLKLRALAVEQMLSERYRHIGSYIRLSIIDEPFKLIPRRFREEVLEKLILFNDIIDEGFPYLGSLVDSYRNTVV